MISDKSVGLGIADIVAAYDYMAFGMIAKSFNPTGARYQYNGKEVDHIGLGGGGATYDYGFRIYNPQIARFLSVDPLAPDYPWYTPYQFAGNNPIKFIDLDGLEPATNEDKQAAIDKVDAFENDANTTSAWSNVTKADFVSSLKNMINNPSSIDQASTNLCGIAAACKTAIEYDPISFVDNALELYQTGQIKSRNILYSNITPNEELRNGSPSNGLDAASFVMMSSVRDAGNYALDYTPKTDKNGARGFGYPDDIINFLTNFHDIGNKSPFGSTLLGRGGVKDISNALSNGQSVIARFDWSQLTTGTPSTDRLQRNFGSHYVQITNITETNGSVTINYWSWGAQQPAITTKKDTFIQSLKGFSTLY